MPRPGVLSTIRAVATGSSIASCRPAFVVAASGIQRARGRNGASDTRHAGRWMPRPGVSTTIRAVATGSSISSCRPAFVVAASGIQRAGGRNGASGTRHAGGGCLGPACRRRSAPLRPGQSRGMRR
ncbi:hypothetical protein IT882_15390 [Microbacterium schleiferi]|uniref:Uncharacterized protein n=1 Tax=Microbacterium schleiferi TaxID=69362 RepID=A0A7S8MX07_9MICO|nr:hypothetical protein [Microbacterium schleiferi]QPE04493.1 hypothetical protein IT882_15390 [Microbacterium schleiferi]